MTITTLEDLFHHTLKDVLYAERKILKVLPKMERKVTDSKLKTILAANREEIEDQVVRLDEVFEILGVPARGAKCDAMVGLVEETEGLIGEIEDPETMDAALISLAQAMDHYKLARYGTLAAWAKQLGHAKAGTLLKATLDEVYGSDRKLSALAEDRVNASAAA
jgi:ferritin-like metal-binding protein YciE